MARTWLSVTVELLGGRGEEVWPWPGRVLAVGPSHTFMDLARAINDAFARWDRSHLSMFTLADGRVVTDEETGAELAGGIGGPVSSPLDIETTKVAGPLEFGAELQFTFDLGDEWVHRLVIGDVRVDPVEVLGAEPSRPLPYVGWGTIPDQHGRRWEGDDGEAQVPRRPSRPHPMQLGTWPEQEQQSAPDLQEVRASVRAGDADRFLGAINGRDIDDLLQLVGAGVPMVLRQKGARAETVALSVINRLTWRGGAGDEELGEDLTALLRGEDMPGRLIPVDLDELSSAMEGDPSMSTGGVIDLHTGEVYDDAALDAAMVGEEYAIDVEEDRDRWLRFDCEGSRDGWRDMAAFAAGQRDPSLREGLERAIEGKGAFRRFRDLVHDEGLAEQWYAFADDRRDGRAREFLASEGIRPWPQDVAGPR